MTRVEAEQKGELCFRLNIALVGIRPPVFRSVVVPAAIKLSKLHMVIQAAMGWTNSHLHEFEIGDDRYGVPDPYLDEQPKAESRVQLSKALKLADAFTYIYDFGDDWEHRIVIEAYESLDASGLPFCIGGAGACPPEDVGGVWGFARFLDEISNPEHPEHAATLEWYGGAFDPAAFDLATVNRRLQKIKL
jgi:hypothetical protein